MNRNTISKYSSKERGRNCGLTSECNRLSLMLTLLTAAVCLCICNLLPGLTAAEETGIAEEVKLSASVDSFKAPLNRDVELSIELQWTGEMGDFEFEEPDFEHRDGFHVRSVSSANQRQSYGDSFKVLKKYLFKLRAEDTGKLEIPPVKIRYRPLQSGASEEDLSFREEARILSTSPILVDIGSPIISENLQLSRSLVVFVCIVIVLVIGGIIFIKLKTRRTGEKLEEMMEEDALTRGLNSIKEADQLRYRGEFKQLALKFEEILTGFITEMGIEVSGNDIEASMEKLEREGITEESLKGIECTLKLANLVKFAGHVPSPEELSEAARDVESTLRKWPIPGVEEQTKKISKS